MSSRLVQCEITTPTSTGMLHTLTWVEESTKPKPGSIVPMKDDSRVWTVKHAYTLIPRIEK